MFRIYPFLLSIACSTTKTTPEPESGNIVLDADGDGYDDTEDCDDNNSAINPSAEEICDSLDNNCDGDIDEGVQDEFFADSDNDGFGNPDISTFSCSTPDGFVSNGSDCDDTESFSYPGATETCDGIDNDCNGEIDDGLGATYYLDEDNDGFGDETNPISACSLDDGLATITGDCDDTNPAINPVAAELCDEIDNNCNGDIDEGVQNTYYADQDEDGYGSLDLIVYACTLPEDYVTITGDCNDIESLAYPGAIEYCDLEDNNCDGEIDEDTAYDARLWYADDDEDGFGDPNSTTMACFLPAGHVSDNTDCDDTNGLIHPSAAEICDTLDNNCDNNIDEQDPLLSDATTWYLDHDADGFGDASFSTTSCHQPSGYVLDDTDCNDLRDDIHPSATELCGHVDHNCDGTIGDNDPLVDLSSAQEWYLDADQDTYGDPSQTEQSCTQPNGYVSDNTDCNDDEVTINPTTLWYLDHDEDGFGDLSFSTMACEQPTSYVSDNTDCNDLRDEIYPGAPKGCFEDFDCDGAIDSGDEDGDGYASLECDGNDCDDNDASVYPGQSCEEGGSCQEILDQDPTATTGSYLIDPDGYNIGNDPFEVICNMDLADGGWTLIATNSGSDWSTTLVIDNTLFSTSSLSVSFKGEGWNLLPFSDILFSNDAMHAAYEGVSDGIQSYYDFSSAIPLHNCGLTDGYEYAMTQGNFSDSNQQAGYTLCSTNLYMHPADEDGTYPVSCSLDNESYGPTWSMSYNNGCYLDDPSASAFYSQSSYNPWTGSPLRMWVR